MMAQRLAAQALSDRSTSVVEAGRRLLGIQAQDLAQARWALGVRCAGASLADVERAFATRALVRAWCMRGTLHIVPAEDLPWLVALLGPRNLARAAGRLRTLGISDRDVTSARKVAERSLRGRTLAREELFVRLEHAGQRVAGQRGVYLLYCLTQHGVLCQAGERFALVEDWVAHPRALAGDEALAELARRYAQGHGPATPDDFAFWTGLTRREARRAMEIAGVASTSDAGVPAALLLPGYDEYLLGYADRSTYLAKGALERIVPGGNGVFRPMLVVAGHIRGTWRRRLEPERVTLTVSPFARLRAAQRSAVVDAARVYGAFVGKPLVVRFDAG